MGHKAFDVEDWTYDRVDRREHPSGASFDEAGYLAAVLREKSPYRVYEVDWQGWTR